MKNKYAIIGFLTVFFTVYALPLLAQIGGPTPPAAPIDGGLSLLIAGGIGYGVKKIRENKRKKQ